MSLVQTEVVHGNLLILVLHRDARVLIPDQRPDTEFNFQLDFRQTG
jgi:hypothetical protein